MHPQDTPENERLERQMQATRESLSDKIGTLEGKVMETVQQATAVVDETTAAVKATVTNVRNAFDLPGAVQKRPWMMVGGAVVTGFVVGKLLDPMLRSRDGDDYVAHRGNGKGKRSATAAAESAVSALGGTTKQAPRWTAEAQKPPQPSSGHEEEKPAEEANGLMASLGSHLSTLKGLAIGTLFDVIKGAVTKGLSPEIAQPISEIVDDLTKQLGGTPQRKK